jgi:hypothetical protein
MAITIKLHVVAARIQVAADATELLHLKNLQCCVLIFQLLASKFLDGLEK